MAVNFRLADSTDAVWFAAFMRDEDHRELKAASGPNTLRTLHLALELSCGRAFVAETEHEPVCLFGFAPEGLLAAKASPWLVGTRALDRLGRTMTVAARDYCRAALREFPILENYVDARHTASLKWLPRVGFTVYDPEPFGVEGRPFHRFEMRSALV